MGESSTCRDPDTKATEETHVRGVRKERQAEEGKGREEGYQAAICHTAAGKIVQFPLYGSRLDLLPIILAREMQAHAAGQPTS